MFFVYVSILSFDCKRFKFSPLNSHHSNYDARSLQGKLWMVYKKKIVEYIIFTIKYFPGAVCNTVKREYGENP